MATPNMNSAEYIRQHVKEDREQELIVLGHEIDDEGQTEGSYEYVMDHLRAISGFIRVQLDETLGVQTWRMPKTYKKEDEKQKYVQEIAEYSKDSSERMEKAVHIAIREKKKILSLGGNHLRVTELLGLLKACHELGHEVCLVWTDAHPDLNTPETTESGNVHGMVASIAIGEGPDELLKLMKQAPFLKPENIVYIGTNAIDPEEAKRLIAKKIKVLTISEMRLEGTGLKPAIDKITEINERIGDKAIWWNELDVDVLDDRESEGKVMANQNGMFMGELEHLYLWMGTNKKMNILGIGVSEIAPAKDPEGRMAELVGQNVGALLGIPNIDYAKHMKKNTLNRGVAQQNVGNPAPMQKNVVQAANNVISQPHHRRRVLDFIAGAAAAVAAMIAGNQLNKPSEKTAENQPEIRQPLGKNYDRAYAFTGISSQNRFQPPGFERKTMYSVERLKQEIEQYKTAVRSGDSMLDYKKRLLNSILYLAELKGNTVPMWDHARESLSTKEYQKLRTDYQAFRSSISQPEQKEIDDYLAHYDRPTA